MKNTRAVFVQFIAVMLGCGAFTQLARSQETPPVLDQIATVAKCEPQKICLGEQKDHQHKAVQRSSLNDKKRFKIERKFPGRSLRHINVLDEWFDELERPGLHLIHPDMNPFSEETFQISDSNCVSRVWKDCVKFRDFPLAFGIYDLENPLLPGQTKPTKSPHAFVYIPMRFNDGGYDDKLAGKGDHYLLMILHIPDDKNYCGTLETRLEKMHCELTVRLKDAWKSKQYPRARMRLLVAGEYRWLFDHLLDESSGAFRIEAHDAKGIPLISAKDSGSLRFSLDLLSKIGIFLHNDIIHGDLQ